MKRMYMTQARKYLAVAVETQGRDFRYNTTNDPETGCHYFPMSSYGDKDPRSKTGCLIGTAFKVAGVKQDIIKGMQTWIRDQRFSDEFFLSSDAREYLYKAQKIQDSGGTWGEAYDAAEEWYANKSGG